MISFRILGAPSASRVSPGERVAPLLVGKPVALLAYLACAPASSATRPRLVDLLWSDVDIDAGKHALRQTLWYIKRRLGDGIVVAENDHLVLAPGYQCDRTDFLAAIDRGDLEVAVNLYTGPFFPDFATPGGAEFERWADVERAHLCGKFVRAAEDVCRRWLHHGNSRPAIALARRARDADPENESLWRLVLEALLAASDRIGAASEGDALLRRLAEDEREPEMATKALLRAARNVDHAQAESVDTRATLLAELVGREQEFSQIISAWERTRSGNSAHIHLTAPAGLGKTRLIADVEARLRASRARVVRLRAAPGERQMPYALAAELVAALARLRGAAGVSSGAASSLVALNPVVSTWLAATPDAALGEDALRRRSLATHELLVAVSTETPVALLIDDLHWVDSESSQLLSSIASRLQSASALLVTASRPPSPFPVDGAAQQVVSLQPLDASQVGALIASIANLPEQSWADALSGELHSATGGSPLLVLEMLQYALDRQSLLIDDGTWRCANNDALLADLRPGRAVERRVAELDSAAKVVLLTLSLSGVPTSSYNIAKSIGRSEHDVEATLARLEHAGLITRDGANWLPQHDEIAAAIIAATTESNRRSAQRGLAVALSGLQTAEPGTMRRALSHAMDSGDDQVLSRVASAYVQQCRGRGDSRDTNSLLSEALGANVPKPLVRGLTQSLPFAERISLYRLMQRSAAVALVLVLAVLIPTIVRKYRPVPRNTLLLQVATATDTTLRSVDILDSSGETELPLRVDNEPVAGAQLQRIINMNDPIERADRSAWIGWQDLAINGKSNPELVAQIGDNEWERIAPRLEDDVKPNWSPDGNTIVYLTRGWAVERSGGRRHDLDIATFDVRTGQVTQITSTDDDDLSPVISPDGTRIAFLRTSNESESTSRCLMSLSGEDLECGPLTGFNSNGGLAWRNNDEILLRATTIDGQSLALLKWIVRTGDVTTLHTGAASYSVSPDGRAVVLEQQDPATSTRRHYLAPVDHMTRRRLLLSESGSVQKVVWRASRIDRHDVRRISLLDSITTATVGVPTQLEARAVDGAGELVTGVAIRFHSLDSNAKVNERGILIGRKEGVARIVAGAGMSLSDTVAVRFVQPTFREVLSEGWSKGVGKPWRGVGDPVPTANSNAAEGSVLFLRGNGNYASGVFTAPFLFASHGAGVEMWGAAKIDGEVWKSIAVSLITLPDSAVLDEWKNNDAGFPTSWLTPARDATCALGAPAQEGRKGMRTLSASAAEETKVIDIPSEITDGSFHRWRIQILPDGRCGFALDGRVIWISQRRVRQARPFSVWMSGQSVGTRILVDSVRAWTGIAPDIDWSISNPGRIAAGKQN